MIRLETPWWYVRTSGSTWSSCCARATACATTSTSDPDLIDPSGDPVETWREDYPYDERLDRDVYEEQKYQLQIELLKFQYWAQDTGTRHAVLFEGLRQIATQIDRSRWDTRDGEAELDQLPLRVSNRPLHTHDRFAVDDHDQQQS
ncbi:hypothetical protein [Pseudonocardia broussonetiae]|uniref:hypothetical protein n=1 Tax=Pseudonocardia broussonetiae TaxID=2736640 RepID=UPI001966AC64|nr:hypothetical protein [Pseudonocardia broussonetiae]